MPQKARSQDRQTEDDDYRIQNTVARNRIVSKESDHVDESDSSESPSETISSNSSDSFRMSERLVISKHESVFAPESGLGDATDNILPDRSEINETDRSRDDTEITESHVEWTKAKQALVDIINEMLSHDPVLRAKIFAVLDPIDNPKRLVAMLAQGLSKCDLFAELPTKSECNKRKPTWISRGTNATIRDSDESNLSSDECETDSVSAKNAGPTTGDAEDVQSVLTKIKELTIDLHMDKSNLVPINDLDGRKNAAPSTATWVKIKNLSVRNEFDDASSDDDDYDDDDDSSSLASINLNASDDSDDENYITRGARSARDTYSAAIPNSRRKNPMANHEYTSCNIKNVNPTTSKASEQTKLYIPPGLETPPSGSGDMNYRQHVVIPQTNNGLSIPPDLYSTLYSPVSLSGDQPDTDAYQSVSNDGFVQNDGPCLDQHSELQDFFTSDYVPVCQESERSQNTASFSQSESVSAEKNSSEHDDYTDQDIQSTVMQALRKLTFREQKMLLCEHCDDKSMIRQLLADLWRSDLIISGKTRNRKVKQGQPNRNPLTVKQIIDEKLQVSIDPKLTNKMKADKLLAKMAQVFDLDDQDLMPANNETVLMHLLKEPDSLSSNIELFVVLIERMTRIPASFNNRDEQNRSALYLAAINFPTMPEIVGHLAKIMLECYAQFEMKKQLDETILGVLSKGDTHIEVLEELLNMERSGTKIFDVNSYISWEGTTMLEIANQVNTIYAGAAVRTIELLKRNARHAFRDYNASLDNAIIRLGNNTQSDLVEFVPRVIAGYVRYTADGGGITLVSDQFQNRQIVM